MNPTIQCTSYKFIHNHMLHTETPHLLKAADAALCIGITKSTVYDWIARGYIPCHRFGRTIRIDARDLADVIAKARLNDFATERELAAQNVLLDGAPARTSPTDSKGAVLS
jgi:excisionase family DNA binding protein